MRTRLSHWYNQFWMPIKYYTHYLFRSIRKKDQDDNPFIIF
ncbi:hypothetical protein [Longitalea luteola]|nr:hypothetical protein [Longitalea luteola]